MTAKSRRLALLALLAPATLVGCSAVEGMMPGSSEALTTVSSVSDAPEQTTASSSTEPTTPSPTADPEAQRFATGPNTYAVRVPGKGACTIDSATNTMMCRVANAEAFDFPSATSLHDPVVGFYPVPDGDPTPYEQAEEIRPGESVTIDGTIITHGDDGDIRVNRGPHWFALVDNKPVLGESPYSLEEPPPVDGPALMGEVCGQVTIPGDIPLNITALADETSCPAAKDAVTAYIFDHAAEGEWATPGGWVCSRDYAFPSEDVKPEDRFPTCTHPDKGSAAAVSMKWP